MNGMLRLFLQGVLAVAIVAAGLIVGEQLRASRERLATGQAGSAASVQPTTVPTPVATIQVTAPPQQATPAPAARTVVPTPITTPFTGTKTMLTGTITKGGATVPLKSSGLLSSNKAVIRAVPKSKLTAGSYKVSWRARAGDGHSEKGTWSFKISG